MLVLTSRHAAAAMLTAAALVVGTVVAAPVASAAAPSAAPVQTAPSNGGDTGGNPVMSWQAVPGAALYRVQVSTSSAFSPTAYTVDTVNTNATPPTELTNSTFFWRVAAADSSKALGPWSQVWSFRKTAGEAPTGLSPADGASFTYPSGTPVLEWSPVAGVKTYKIQVDDNSSFLSPIVAPSTANTAYAVSAALTLGKPYYWRVWGVSLGGQETAKTDARQFTVDWPSSAPAPQTPANLATVSDVVLSWSQVAGAKDYLLEVSANGDFTNNVIDSQTVKGTQYSPTATYANGGYFWRVSPRDTLNRQGLWSSTRQFTRASEAPAAPTNLVSDSAQFSFSWDPVPNGGVYEIQFDADNNFSAGAIACTVYHNRYTAYSRPSQPTGAPKYPAGAQAPAFNDCTPNPGTWWWKVRALDTQPDKAVGQFGPFSAAQSVTVAYPAAPAGSLAQMPASAHVSPADCSVTCTPQADTPLLRWNAAPGARSYYVRIASDPDFTTEVERYFVVGTELQPRESLPDNSAGTSYYWWVQPCSDLVGTSCVPDDQPSIVAGATSFRKLAEPVVLSSPAASDPAPVVTDVVTMSWASSYSTQPTATGAGSYRVQVANDDAFTSVVDEAEVDQTTYQAYLSTYPDSLYYWRVQAVDSSGLGLSWSEPRTFVKKSSKPSSLVSARLDDASAVPVLNWASNAYVSGYVVQVYAGTNVLFPAASLVKESTVLLPTYTLDITLPAGTYSWRVRRLDPSGNPGPWQEQTNAAALPTFVVAAPRPGLLAPADGSLVAGNGVLYTWTAVKGATQYRLESSLFSGFGSLIENPLTVMTSWAPSVAYPDSVPVYWRVRALDGANNVLSTSTPMWSFQKDAVGPTPAIDVSAGPKSLQPSIPVTFSEGVTGIGATTVRLSKTGGAAVSASLACSDGGGAAVGCAGSGIRKVVVKPVAKVVPGETYTVTVTPGVTDSVGNPAGVIAASFRAILSVQQNAGSAKYVGTWTTVSTKAASGGSYAKATSTKASASWAFRGSSVKVSYVAQKAAGKAKIYVDGVLKKTLDMYSSTTGKRTYVLSVTKGLHTVKVVPAGSKNTAATSTAVNVDLFTTS